MINNKHNANEGELNMEELFEGIIIAETELEDDLTYSNLNKLIDLYLKGIKAYETINQEKVKMFERKLNYLMQKPNIKAILKEKQNDKKENKSYISEKIKNNIVQNEKNVKRSILEDVEKQNTQSIENLNVKRGNKNIGNSNSSTNSTNSEGKVNNKNEMIIEDINKIIMNYVGEYNLYFYKYYFSKTLETLKQIVQEKYNKYIDISKNYYSQIKETQFTLSQDNTKTEQEIESIISSLKEEKNIQLFQIEDEYNKTLNSQISTLKEIAFQKSNPSILFLQEKLQYSIYEKMNHLFEYNNSPYHK